MAVRMDETRQFSHEEIDGPEEDGVGELDNCDILSEGSDGEQRDPTLPPYPGHASISAATAATPTTGQSRNYSHDNSTFGPCPPLGQAPPRSVPTAQASAMRGPPANAARSDHSQQNIGQGRNSRFNGPPMPPAQNRLQSPPSLPVSTNDSKPFRGPVIPDGWAQGNAHRPIPPRDPNMMFPRRQRPGNLDLPSTMAPAVMGNGMYHPGYAGPDPRGRYSMVPQMGHMGQAHGMMYHQRAPGHAMMMAGRMMMPHPPAMAEQQFRKPPHIKKPLNAFMLFMKEQRAKVVAECTLKESAAINQILGKKWHGLTRTEQAKYYDMAREERQQHQRMYPNYNPRDAYNGMAHRRGRRQRRGERLENDEMTQLKKCRARYGLEHQEKWCKPCRRKKKCTKFTSADDMGTDDEDSGTKRERESRNQDDDNDDDSGGDEVHVEDDEKTIASAMSSGDENYDDEDMAFQFNDEEQEDLPPLDGPLISPTISSNGGIAVLANKDATSLGGPSSSGFGSLFPGSAMMSSSSTSPMSLGVSADLSLGAISGADMILVPTPAAAEKEMPLLPVADNGTALNSFAASVLSTCKDPLNGSSLTPMTTPEDSQQETPDENCDQDVKTNISLTIPPPSASALAAGTVCGQKPRVGAPAAVLSTLPLC